MNKLLNFMKESSVARFLIPSGIILIIVGIIFLNAGIKNQNYLPTTSTISNVEILEPAHTDTDGTRVEETYRITVKYNINNKDYETKLDNVSKYKVGDHLTIYYNPDDPSMITETKSLIIPIIITASGTITLLGGIMSSIISYNNRKKEKEQEKGWEKPE